MRRVLLTLILAFAVAAGGFITVSAAAACPILNQAPAHECCPDDQRPADDGDAPGKSALDCALMQLCRAAPAVAIEAADLAAPIPVVMAEAAQLIPPAPRLAPLDGVFRPPRSL